MIAKRTGWPSVRRNIGYDDRLAATQRRPAPAAMNRTPKITPIASGPPPAPIAGTIIARPRTSMAIESSLVAAPCTPPTLRHAAQARQRRAPRRRGGAVSVLGVGVDDHAARTIGEDGLDRLAEHRAAGARRQRHD